MVYQELETAIVGLKEEVSKGRNDEPYSGSGAYNCVPVLLHCNCFVLDLVY
jgi:hypothetical protein